MLSVDSPPITAGERPLMAEGLIAASSSVEMVCICAGVRPAVPGELRAAICAIEKDSSWPGESAATWALLRPEIAPVPSAAISASESVAR
ncbi:hypothetical protein ShzoTeo12_04780 [Shinella zoogloeoides]|nr:hypothetical protein ShzoTeo12_04780 [Shinella zoogloeoides]